MDELTSDYDRITKWAGLMHCDIASGTCNREFMNRYARERLSMIKTTEENVDLLKEYCGSKTAPSTLLLPVDLTSTVDMTWS